MVRFSIQVINKRGNHLYFFLRLFWSKKIWFIIKFCLSLLQILRTYLLQLPELDFSMRHFWILAWVKCFTWYYCKCPKKKISFKKCISVKKKFVVIQIHLLQKMNVYTCSESKYKDKFSYTHTVWYLHM